MTTFTAPSIHAASTPTVDDLVTGTITGREWLIALAILVGGFIVAGIARRVVRRVFRRGSPAELVAVDETAASLLARVVQILLITIALVYALLTLGVQVGPLFGALGIGGIALAFALQDTLENFIGGLVLQLRRPFLIGDQIEVAAQAGAVLDIGFRYVRLRRFDGTVALIPARMVLQDVVVNNTAEPRRRTSLNVAVARDTDLTRAREAIIAAVSAAPSVVDDPAPDVMVTALGPWSIDLTVRYWHNTQRSDGVRATDEVGERLQRALADAGIKVPTPPAAMFGAPDDGTTGA